MEPVMKDNIFGHKGRLLPGSKPVLELLAEDPHKILKVFYKKNFREAAKITTLCRKNRIPFQEVDNDCLDSLCGNDAGAQIAHQGIAALLSDARFAAIESLADTVAQAPLPILLALDQVRDPGNLGTLCRTAWALGVAGIILPKHNSASLGPAAARSAAGTLEKMSFTIAPNLARGLDYLEERGIFIYGCAALPTETQENSRKSHLFVNAFEHDWQFPCVLVLGGEQKGLRPGVAKRCSLFASIPFARSFDSLNVAQAGAILLGLCAARFSTSTCKS